MRTLSNGSAWFELRALGRPWGLFPAVRFDKVMAAESFPALRRLAPGVAGSMETVRYIGTIGPHQPLSRIIRNRKHRAERGMHKRLQLRDRREQKELSERWDDVRHAMRHDLRRVMKNRATIYYRED